MFKHLAGAAAVALSILPIGHAVAADGEIIITQAKAMAGNVTPGDTAGFPVTLTVPGSYRLASNLSPGPGQNGIIVNSPDVTIDLNGFRMSGGSAGGANNSLNGIVDQTDRLRVKNGTIGAFKGEAIYAKYRLYLIVEDMKVINSGIGIYNFGGSFANIHASTIATNVDSGIVCGVSCQVEDNVISGNGDDGIDIVSGTILGNTIINNSHYGIEVDFSSGNIVGFGNNTLVGNYNNNVQTTGSVIKLFPNACSPSC